MLMTNRQAAVLTSRIFCVWFAYSAVGTATMLPGFIRMFQQSLQFASDRFGSAATFNQSALMNLVGFSLRAGIEVAAALLCYRCGPWLVRFLTGSESDADAGEVEATT